MSYQIKGDASIARQLSAMGGKQANLFTIEGEVDFTTAEPAHVNGELYVNGVTGAGSTTVGTVFTSGRMYRSNGTDWQEIVPSEGWVFSDNATNSLKRYDGTAWVNASSSAGVSADPEQLLKLGSDSLPMLEADDMISLDVGNSIIKGTDGRLLSTGGTANVITELYPSVVNSGNFLINAQAIVGVYAQNGSNPILVNPNINQAANVTVTNKAQVNEGANVSLIPDSTTGGTVDGTTSSSSPLSITTSLSGSGLISTNPSAMVDGNFSFGGTTAATWNITNGTGYNYFLTVTGNVTWRPRRQNSIQGNFVAYNSSGVNVTSTNGNGNPTIRLYYSDDGLNWTLVATNSVNSVFRFDFNPSVVEAAGFHRYWRFESQGSAAFGGPTGVTIKEWFSYAEYQVPSFLVGDNGEVELTSAVDLSAYDTLSSASVSRSEPANTTIRWLVSFDNGTTWQNDSAVVARGSIATQGMTSAQLPARLAAWTKPEGTQLLLAAHLETQTTSAAPEINSVSFQGNSLTFGAVTHTLVREGASTEAGFRITNTSGSTQNFLVSRL